jgi:hypothetical protein
MPAKGTRKRRNDIAADSQNNMSRENVKNETLLEKFRRDGKTCIESITSSSKDGAISVQAPGISTTRDTSGTLEGKANPQENRKSNANCNILENEYPTRVSLVSVQVSSGTLRKRAFQTSTQCKQVENSFMDFLCPKPMRRKGSELQCSQTTTAGRTQPVN